MSQRWLIVSSIITNVIILFKSLNISSFIFLSLYFSFLFIYETRLNFVVHLFVYITFNIWNNCQFISMIYFKGYFLYQKFLNLLEKNISLWLENCNHISINNTLLSPLKTLMLCFCFFCKERMLIIDALNLLL